MKNSLYTSSFFLISHYSLSSLSLFFFSFFFVLLFLDYKTLFFVSLNFRILTILSLLMVRNESSNSILFIDFQIWHFTSLITSFLYYYVTSVIVTMITTTIFDFNPCYLTSTRTWFQSPSRSPFFHFFHFFF